MIKQKDRTRSFKRRIAIEREALAVANKFSEGAGAVKLLGLSHMAMQRWIFGLEGMISDAALREIDGTLRELSRATGLLSDESRCAVAEGKVSSDLPELLISFKLSLLNAEALMTAASGKQ